MRPCMSAGEHRDTLNLPRTDFPMRAELPRREAELLAGWTSTDLGDARAENPRK